MTRSAGRGEGGLSMGLGGGLSSSRIEKFSTKAKPQNPREPTRKELAVLRGLSFDEFDIRIIVRL